MVKVRSCAFAGHVEPVLSRVVLAFYGVGNTSARRENALFFDYDAILRACALLRAISASRQHHSGGRIGIKDLAVILLQFFGVEFLNFCGNNRRGRGQLLTSVDTPECLIKLATIHPFLSPFLQFVSFQNVG